MHLRPERREGTGGYERTRTAALGRGLPAAGRAVARKSAGVDARTGTARLLVEHRAKGPCPRFNLDGTSLHEIAGEVRLTLRCWNFVLTGLVRAKNNLDWSDGR